MSGTAPGLSTEHDVVEDDASRDASVAKHHVDAEEEGSGSYWAHVSVCCACKLIDSAFDFGLYMYLPYLVLWLTSAEDTASAGWYTGMVHRRADLTLDTSWERQSGDSCRIASAVSPCSCPYSRVSPPRTWASPSPRPSGEGGRG